MKDKFYCVMQNQNSRNNELHIFKVFEKTGNVACQSIITGNNLFRKISFNAEN